MKVWSCLISNFSQVFKLKKILGYWYMCFCAIYTQTHTNFHAYMYFYIWACTLIVCNSVQNTKEIYLCGSCLLQTWLFFNLFIQRKLIGYLWTINSQWLQIFLLSKESFAFEIKTIKRFWRAWHYSVTQFFIFFFLKLSLQYNPNSFLPRNPTMGKAEY